MKKGKTLLLTATDKKKLDELEKNNFFPLVLKEQVYGWEEGQEGIDKTFKDYALMPALEHLVFQSCCYYSKNVSTEVNAFDNLTFFDEGNERNYKVVGIIPNVLDNGVLIIRKNGKTICYDLAKLAFYIALYDKENMLSYRILEAFDRSFVPQQVLENHIETLRKRNIGGLHVAKDVMREGFPVMLLAATSSEEARDLIYTENQFPLVVFANRDKSDMRSIEGFYSHYRSQDRDMIFTLPTETPVLRYAREGSALYYNWGCTGITDKLYNLFNGDSTRLDSLLLSNGYHFKIKGYTFIDHKMYVELIREGRDGVVDSTFYDIRYLCNALICEYGEEKKANPLEMLDSSYFSPEGHQYKLRHTALNNNSYLERPRS